MIIPLPRSSRGDRTSSFFVVLIALLLAAVPARAQQAPARFTVSSTDLPAGGTFDARQLYSGFGCTGGNVSPALSWNGAPAGTKSYAVTMYDPDAPTGSGWWHWVVYDIPASVTSLPAGAGSPGGVLPSGAVQGRTDFGSTGYGGPCPPAGDRPHRYVFTVHALSVPTIDAPADATAAMIGFMLHANVLGTATLTTRYGR